METPSKIGRYRIESWLASGAMGDVYRGHDPIINRPVAIKVLRRDLVRGGDFQSWLERFRREAHAAGRRFHPNIVTILDFGEEGGAPFLAMEYIEGRSLDALLKEAGRLSLERGVSIVLQILEALRFAHADGIVHRDIKPSNIMVLDSGDVKVADFGVAHIDSSELTVIGDVLGTPAYMAPEQLWGAPIDHRTDLFAAGVVLFEAITGVKPFRGKSVTEIISYMQTRGPEDVLAHVPTAPPVLKDVISRALAFDPDQRYASAAEFSRALIEASAADISLGPAATQRENPVLTATEAPGPSSPSSVRSAADVSEGPPPSVELLAQLERNLTRIIGPLARIVIQRELKSSSSLAQIQLRLATYIDGDVEREEFLRSSMEHLAATQETSSMSARTGAAQQDGPGQSAAAILSPELLRQVEVSLTRSIGPIARVLVRRELSKSPSAADFFAELANCIPDERDRMAFLKMRPIG